MALTARHTHALARAPAVGDQLPPLTEALNWAEDPHCRVIHARLKLPGPTAAGEADEGRAAALAARVAGPGPCGLGARASLAFPPSALARE